MGIKLLRVPWRGEELSVTWPDVLGTWRPAAVPLAYLGAILAAELVYTLIDVSAGFLCHAGLLSALACHGALAGEARRRALLWALAQAPLLRMLSLSLPLSPLPPATWYAIVSLPIFVASLLIALRLGYTPERLGVALRSRDVALTLPLLPVGLLLGLAEYLALQPQPLAAGLTLRELWLPAISLTFATGVVEEFVFRGVLLRAAVDALGSLWGILYVSVLFAGMHIGFRSAADLLIVFAAGWLFAAVVWRTESLVGVTLAHAAANVSMFLIWPFLIPIGR